MDAGFDPTAVMAFVKEHHGWYGCLYVTGKKTEAEWDDKSQMVKVGRDYLRDAAHHAIVDKRLSLHAKDEFWPDYVKMMTNLKRSVVEDPRTGARKSVWIVTGGAKFDHSRRSGAYCMLAAQRVGLGW